MDCCLYFFFFFQAEDGIRDYKVTGVQTCALPISAQGPAAADGGSDRGDGRLRGGGARANRDRKSTRLNSSHLVISYGVLSLKKNSKEAKMGKVMRHTLGASLNIRHNLSSSKGPKPLQLKLLTTYFFF